MASFKNRWEQWLHPEIRASPELRRQALVMGSNAAFAFLVVLGQVAVSLLSGHVTRAIPGMLFLAGPVLSLVLLRVRKTPNASGHVLFALSSALMCVAVAGEVGLQPGTLAWFGVVFATAILGLGMRAGVTWLVIDAAAVIVIELLKSAGHFTPWLHPSAPMMAVRAVGLVLAFVVLALLFERTRRSGLEEAARLAQTKTNFLANVSHELRTPMNGVLGLTDLLLQSELTFEQREHLELLQRSGRSLVVLLNDLLDMSKVEAGKMELDPTDFDLLRQLEDLRALHEPVALGRGLRLSLEVPALPRAMRGDALRLRQVLNNLLNNAIKFTPKGSITLTVKQAAEGLFEFRVTDTGIGIAKDVLPRLFSAFAQAEAGITRRYGGTGLGLALSRELVALLGGSLEVASEPGKGTTLRFTIPLQTGLAALIEAEPLPVPRPAAQVLPVLVVDDNPINLRVACGLVEKAGYRTLTATNGQEALAVVESQPVFLVLMDCHMPVMDGYEATERIRALDSDVALVPVIALTASAMPEELERCRSAGMNDCLIKPVSLAMVERTLNQVAALQALMS
ncbi:MAG: ATP-binding protein [Archangium sp.]|nr:ATP-binding protein [Archangium sp.]MDP3153188.1 ATP-binding protein [Archangium sp.]MDP3570222.1 ATP-binding protein [Archangium sp.]